MKGGEGYSIHGFDVDGEGNFYFLGCQKAILVCFTKDGKSVYRKHLLNHYPGSMHIVGKNLYYFETWNGLVNTLVRIDKTTGSIIEECPNSITKVLKSRNCRSIDDYQFNDSTLTISYEDDEGIEKLKNVCFDLKAQVIPQCDSSVTDSLEHLGKFDDNYVLGKFDGDKYDLFLKDSANKTKATGFIETKYLGKPLCGFTCLTQEHRKVRNNKLYLLNRDKNMAVVTVIDLATVFHVQ